MEGVTPGWRFISVKQDFSLISGQIGILHKIFVSLYEGFFSLTYQADWSFQPDFPWILIINLIVYIVLPLIGAGSVPFQTQIKISNWIKNASKKNNENNSNSSGTCRLNIILVVIYGYLEKNSDKSVLNFILII